MKELKDLQPFTTRLTKENLKGLKVLAANSGEFLVQTVNKVISKGLKK